MTASIAAAVVVPDTLLDEDGTNAAACALREAVTAAASGVSYGGCPAPTDGVVEIGAGTYQVSLPGPIVIAVSDPARLADGLVLRGAGSSVTRIAGSGPDVTGLLRISTELTGPRIEIRNLELAGSRDSALSLWAPAGVELLVEDVDFRSNRSGFGAAVRAEYSQESLDYPTRLTFRRTRFEDNLAGAIEGYSTEGLGGAVFCADAFVPSPIRLRFEEVLFRNNTAESGWQNGGGGGHLFNYGCSLDLQRVTFAGGRAESSGPESNGGAVVLVHAGLNSASRFENVTFSGNFAQFGGALYAVAEGQVELESVTFADNVAPGGGEHLAVNTDRIEGGILARNVLFGPGGSDAPDCVSLYGTGATVDSVGGNLDSDATCGLDGPGDQPGVVDPGVEGALADQGGFTPTLALLRGSAAIDRGIDGFPATDQRGQPRPIDGDLDSAALPDVGAFETLPVGVTAQEIPAVGLLGAGLLSAAIALAGLATLARRRRFAGGSPPSR